MKSVLFLLGATAFSYLLNKILLRFSNNFGIESRQSQNLVRWSTATKPTTGGISFYITFLLGTLTLLFLRPLEIIASHSLLALLLSGTMAFLIGFADDAYGTAPGLKFLGQVLCGAILIFFGIHINYFSLINESYWFLDYALTIFWVVGIMNSLNMLDNMDAVTTTIASSIVMIAMGMVVLQQGLTNMFYVLVAIVGGFMGFLFWNWKPAKIYMGDTGSMFIGMVLAYVGILFFWNVKASPDNISHVRMGLMPLLVFLVPIMDTTFVTIARISKGGSPFVGGKDHLTHNLNRVGIPEEFVPVTLGIVSLISGSLAIFMFLLTPEWSATYSVFFIIYPIALFTLFGTLYIRGTRISKIQELQKERARWRDEILRGDDERETGIVAQPSVG
jgi:UDP-GlcNAc:undecaprenyl-phosphate GlcNAc-1-phosphate transferase